MTSKNHNFLNSYPLHMHIKPRSRTCSSVLGAGKNYPPP